MNPDLVFADIEELLIILRRVLVWYKSSLLEVWAKALVYEGIAGVCFEAASTREWMRA